MIFCHMYQADTHTQCNALKRLFKKHVLVLVQGAYCDRLIFNNTENTIRSKVNKIAAKNDYRPQFNFKLSKN